MVNGALVFTAWERRWQREREKVGWSLDSTAGMSAGESMAKMGITPVANGEGANRGKWKYRSFHEILDIKENAKGRFCVEGKE